ncbi:unnamed protein product [Ectocarpus sp. CCAP 1310/34]|nr:unnamed protein product [Ectocarpus sp. CCAP 1310/34]
MVVKEHRRKATIIWTGLLVGFLAYVGYIIWETIESRKDPASSIELKVDNDKFQCDCGSECEDRVHVVAECPPLYKKERDLYMTELGKVEGTFREIFEAWNSQEKTVAVMGHSK